ncbi:MAG: hypothetical protein KGK34_02240 [Chloroflexota bacterium]|nr:hypothetical protein [Chloroflexota bacterium]
MSDVLTWRLAKGTTRDRADRLASSFNARGRFSAAVVDGPSSLEIHLKKTADLPAHFRKVELGISTFGRWLPLQSALGEWKAQLDRVTSQKHALEAAANLANIPSTAKADDLFRLVNTATTALALCDAASISQVAAWIEDDCRRQFGEHDALAYVRPYEAVAALQYVELLARLEVIDVEEYASMLDQGLRPGLLAEQSHSAVSANYFLIPLAIAFPDWIGTGGGSLPFQLLFLLRERRTNLPLPDLRHLVIWRASTTAWRDLADVDDARAGQWIRLAPVRAAGFVEWYVERLNVLMERLADPRTTARLGILRPLDQVRMVRTVMQLQDLVGRMLVTSDHFARSAAAIQVLARFDDLGWQFRDIVDETWLATRAAPLEADSEVGGIYESYRRVIQKAVVDELLAGTHGVVTGDTLKLSTGREVKTVHYLGEYLKAVRDSIHGFNVEKLETTFGSQKGTLPINLSQLAALLWLVFLADPDPLLNYFRQS